MEYIHYKIFYVPIYSLTAYLEYMSKAEGPKYVICDLERQDWFVIKRVRIGIVQLLNGMGKPLIIFPCVSRAAPFVT